MKINKLWIVFIFIISTLLIDPLSAFASPISSNNNRGNFSKSVSTITDGINGLAPDVALIFNAIFTIMFLVGIVRMGYSMVTKTGQVMKSSMGLLIWVPLSYFIIKLFILFLFTIKGKNVTLLASDGIRLIQSTSYYTSIGMVLIGLILFLFYRFIDQPEYGRRGKRLWLIAFILSGLTVIMPYVLGAA